ncbi:hypothetical protein LJC31_06475 [Synergistaceae bacterium OttesenSCG-928-I11]|nr:hypothetical protein [Synergistaceae bacterium OttesenSCG-928-I11]
MSKKFLTVFAVVALLIAAMAGTAFAGISVDITRDVVGSSMGEVKGTQANGWSTTVYYLDGAKSADMKFAVSADDTLLVADVKSGDVFISADKIGKVVLSGDIVRANFAKKNVSVDYVISTDLTSPVKTTVGVLSGDTAPTTTNSMTTSFDITLKKVAALDATTITVNKDFTSQDVVVKGYAVSYDFGTLAMSSDKVALGATSKDVISDDKGAVMVTFANGKLHVEQTGVASGEVTLNLYADKFVVSEDKSADVAGFDKSKPIGTVTIKATRSDSSGGSTSKTEAVLLDAATLTEINKLDGVTVSKALLPASFDNTVDGVTITESPSSTKVSAAISADKTIVAGGNSASFVISTDVADAVAISMSIAPRTISSDFGSLSAADRKAALKNSYAIVYEYIDVDQAPAVLVQDNNANATLNWDDALSKGIVVDNNGTLNINYIAVNGTGKPALVVVGSKTVLVIPDGNATDGYLKDPVWLTKKKSSTDPGGHDSSGVGCDAGFGAFALLGLAGAAALLRKKD